MRRNKQWFTYSLMLILVICSRLSASPPDIQGTGIPDYDYSQTRSIILYGAGDYVVMGNPFENPAPSWGNLVYEMISLYASQLQPLAMPSDPPTHVLDLLMKDKYNRTRLGQRLFVGEPWLSDGKSVALMIPADYELLKALLDRRYEAATRYDIGRIKKVVRPDLDSLPEDWSSEPASVQEAIKRLPASDYERAGYDPGARIRRKANNFADGADAPLSTKTIEPAAPDTIRTAENLSEMAAPFPEPAAIIEPVEDINRPSSPSNQEAKPADDRLVFIVLVLLGILMLGLTLRRRKTPG